MNPITKTLIRPRMYLAIGLFLFALQAGWSQRTVSGSVIDAETEEPLIGASVLVEGTTIGTISDINGLFTLEVPKDATTLVVSYTGYQPQNVSIEGVTNVIISLNSGAVLDEVVVVGYGTQKRGDITGSVAVMSTEQLAERPLTRVDQALVGQMAGVRVLQTSGVPGQALKIQVRGTGSITGNTEPLYVVDGFPLEVATQN